MAEKQESKRFIEDIVRIQIPPRKDIEIYILRTEDGKIIARTKEELEEEEKKRKEG